MTTNQHSTPEAPSPTAAVTELAVTGMTCSNCARHVREALQGVAGVVDTVVDEESGSARVTWLASAQPATETLLAAVREAGFAARVREAGPTDSPRSALDGWRLNLWVGALGTLPMMAGEWVLGWGHLVWFHWLSFVLAGTVQVLAGARFYRGAWRQLRAGTSNMDTLVALGSTTAFALSSALLLSGAHDHPFFLEAASIITLVSFGHWLESRVSAQATTALRKLLHLAPPVALRLDASGRETETPVADLRPGDLVALRPGDRVSTDGVVTEGASAVDESMLTGESIPVEKAVGSPVQAGTLNANGRLVVRVTATGEETALAQIIAAVRRAQGSRAAIQRLGDQVSSVFVPIVVLVAAAAGLMWWLTPAAAAHAHEWLARFIPTAHPTGTPLTAGLMVAASVLIVACPCAMGLATPAAIMAAADAAAQRGILIRDGVALEKAGRITAVLFDKTGTLTQGKPEVADTFVLTPAIAEPETGGGSPMARVAASLARHSAHPVSRAIASLSPAPLTVSGWEECRGYGVKALVTLPGTNTLVPARLGSLRWFEEAGGLEPARQFIADWTGRGATITGVSLGSRLLGLVAVMDPLRPEAPDIVKRLQGRGLGVWMVTGDNSRTAATIARQAGIAPERILAEASPGMKAEFVKRLQAQGERVAFVGDGINDSPALEQADIGVAVSRASDIAREAADLILLRPELGAVADALALSRAALRTIKQNLFWAFFYNALAVPLAAFGVMGPILCAAAMGCSDVVVIGNALRLRRWGR